MFSIYGRNPARSPRPSLSTRGHIESLDAGLTSRKGAREVIAAISARRFVTKLILGHNELGDEGCEVLLLPPLGAGAQVSNSEIGLNSNRIGDRGLLAISLYLRDNTTLRELFLQNNAFTGNADVTRAFALALNSSHLETLSLTTNPQLSDRFLAEFLPALDTPYLANVQLSVLGLTPLSGPHIAAYIASPRCRLHTLHATATASACAPRARSSARSRAATSRCSSSSSSSDDSGARRAPWQASEQELRRVLQRNAHLKRATERDALALLRHARAALLRPASRSCAAPGGFPFARLPTELQLHVLSFVAPLLSAAQRIRVCAYAAARATLPPLSSAAGLGFPVSMPGGWVAGWGVPSVGMRRRGSGAGAEGSGGVGANSSGWREQERTRWLALMRCNAFELDGGAACIEDGAGDAGAA
ncbi:RNI-like protein [Amylocystis lapponica]|nr:RNI-like protein [Amylocystis lapponica]